jgi:hypothetical protein
MTLLHERLATSMMLFLSIAGLWGLASYLFRRGVSASYWGILAIGELLVLAQAVAGVVLWLGGARPERGIHLLYGVVAAIGLPGYYAYSKGQDDPRRALNYGLLCLFLVGISLRAVTTAG